MEVFKLDLVVTAYDLTLTGLSLNGDLPVKWHLFIKTNKNLDYHHYSMRRTEMGNKKKFMDKNRLFLIRNCGNRHFKIPTTIFLEIPSRRHVLRPT